MRRTYSPRVELLEELNPPINLFGLELDLSLFAFAGVLPGVPPSSVPGSLTVVSQPLPAPDGARAVGTPLPLPSGRPAAPTRVGQAGAVDPETARKAELAALGMGAGAAIAGLSLPDLFVDTRNLSRTQRTEVRTFAAGDCAVVEGMVDAPGTHKLLRFTTTYPNRGPGDLVIGNPADHPELFELSACHGHYHFSEYADYRLWTQSGYSAWQELKSSNPDALSRDLLASRSDIAAEMVEGAKRGFCIIDIVRYRISGVHSGPAQYTSCGSNQGLSVGWADEYHWSLDGQWIDITGVPAGTYVLEVEVNAEHLFAEANYRDNSTAVSARIR